jgi:hypothetical protein
MAELERWVPRDKREHKVTFSVPRVVRSLNWKFAPKGFYDDIVRARGELANRSGIDQQLTY